MQISLDNLLAFWATGLQWILGLGVGLGVLAHYFPCNPNPPAWRNWRVVRTDLMYYLVMPLVNNHVRWTMFIAALLVLYGGHEPDLLVAKTWPFWLQCAAILLIQDVILYVIHRAFHTRAAWKFHAIHHSPEVLDWTSAARFHPVNNLLEFAVADIAVVMMGFPAATVLWLVPFNMIYSAMVHANLNWTFGPFRYLLASPVFHRWHHTTEEEGLDKNFASTFPILDLLFGTYYMPAERRPSRYGTTSSRVPAGFLGQLIYPLRGYGMRAFARRRPVTASLASLSILTVAGFGALVSWEWSRQLNSPPPSEEMVMREIEQSANESLAKLPMPTLPIPLEIAPGITAVAVTGDGKRFAQASEDGAIKVWDAGAETSRRLAGHLRGVTTLALSSDGLRAVSGSRDRTIKVWDLETGKEVEELTGHASAVTGVAISKDGKRIISGSADGELKVWDNNGKDQRTLTQQVGCINSLAISADGRRVVAPKLTEARVWDVETGKPIILKGHKDLIYCVAMTPDGKRVVTGSFDLTIKIWDAETGKLERTLTGHKDKIYSVAISHDGHWIVSGGYDQTPRVWQVSTGREVFVLKGGHEAAVASVAITADGEQVLSGDMNGVVKTWALQSEIRSIAP